MSGLIVSPQCPCPSSWPVPALSGCRAPHQSSPAAWGCPWWADDTRNDWTAEALHIFGTVLHSWFSALTEFLFYTEAALLSCFTLTFTPEGNLESPVNLTPPKQKHFGVPVGTVHLSFISTFLFLHSIPVALHKSHLKLIPIRRIKHLQILL